MFASREVRIGVTGHRLNQIALEDRPRVSGAVDEALTALEACVREAVGKNAKLTLASALAEGADRMAAHGAIARGWRLEAPLPFSIERYEADFDGPASVQDFQDLLKRADKVVPHPENDKDPDAGYAAVGEAIASVADVMLAIWNGEAPKGPGGTADVAARALEAGAPVVWIAVIDGVKPRLVLPADGAAAKGAEAKRLRLALAARFPRVDRPAEMQVARG